MRHFWLVALDVDVVLALIPAVLARAKGQNFWLWWLYGTVCLPLAPLVHALVLKPASRPDQQPHLPGPELPMRDAPSCRFCAAPIAEGAHYCSACGHRVRAVGTDSKLVA
jgi:hypothetical protein